MPVKTFRTLSLILLSIINFSFVFGQDTRAQYPSFLQHSYFGVSLGYIDYPFTNSQLKEGYKAEAITIPHFAVRITLLGYRFNKNLEAQITYMRPVGWVQYKNINRDSLHHSVFMNVAGLTLKQKLPVSSQLSLYGEGGLAIITRNGFKINGTNVVKDATFSSVFLGAGVEYHANKKWDFLASASYSPESKNHNQPQVISFTGGFRYNMRPLPKETVEKNSSGNYFFPKNVVQISYSTNGLGYGVNNLISKKLHIFWGGGVQIDQGFSLNYLRNVFHVYKVFALDVGASSSYWKSNLNNESIFTASLFPVFRFNLLRTKAFDGYVYYSVAGPAYISKTSVDDKEIGRKFTFRDFMGIGTYMGSGRRLNIETSIGHFSNGNIFPNNSGVKIPLTFTMGYNF